MDKSINIFFDDSFPITDYLFYGKYFFSREHLDKIKPTRLKVAFNFFKNKSLYYIIYYVSDTKFGGHKNCFMLVEIIL